MLKEEDKKLLERIDKIIEGVGKNEQQEEKHNRAYKGLY